MKRIILLLCIISATLFVNAQSISLNETEFTNLLEIITRGIDHEFDFKLDSLQHSCFIIKINNVTTNPSRIVLTYARISFRQFIDDSIPYVYIIERNKLFLMNIDNIEMSKNVLDKYQNDSLNIIIGDKLWLVQNQIEKSGITIEWISTASLEFNKKLLSGGKGEIICKAITDISSIPHATWPIEYERYNIPLFLLNETTSNNKVPSKEHKTMMMYSKCHKLKFDLTTGEIKDSKRKKLVRKGFLKE